VGHRSRREAMVRDQLRRRGVTDQRVLAAMETVERHRFVPHDQRMHAHEDRPLSIGGGQTISQPLVVARMAAELAPGPTDLVLDVGAGSGYATAVLAELAGRVVAIEQDLDLAVGARAALQARHNVEVVHGDGRLGWPTEAPFDAIHVAAAAPRIPPALLAQLADGGRLVMPVGPRSHQRLVLVQRAGDDLQRTDLGGVRFVPLLGGVDPD